MGRGAALEVSRMRGSGHGEINQFMLVKETSGEYVQYGSNLGLVSDGKV